MSEMDEAGLRRVLERITTRLEERRTWALEQVEKRPTSALYYQGMEFQARLSLAYLNGVSNGEYGAVHMAARDSAVTS